MKAPRGFKKALGRAARYIPHPERTLRLVDDATRKADRNRAQFQSLWVDFRRMGRMMRCWANGSYRRVPIRSILYVAAALIYFLDPLDLIPDVLPLIGYVDDMAIIGFVINGVRKDLGRFSEWEVSQGFIQPGIR